ncbi:unnamed protein product [Closterium sp. NIES-53]
MEVARTSMIHAAAPHFLWPFAVRYAAHQLNLWPHVSLPETSPTQRWTGKVGDASVFRVWGSRAFVRDTSADKLFARAIPCVFLGFVPDAPGWQFYHPTSRRILLSHDVMFDESVPFYRLFPYRSAPSPPPPLFLAPGPPPVDPLPPQGPAPSGVSQVDPLLGTAPVQVAIVSGAAPGAASGGAASGGAASGSAEPGGAGSEGARSRGCCLSGGPADASLRVSSQQLREWLVQRAHRRSGAPGAGKPGDAGAGGAAVTTGAGDPTEPGAAGAGGAGACVAGVGGHGAGGAGAAGTGVVDPGAGGVGGTVRPRAYFVPLLQQVLSVQSSTGLPPPFLCPPSDQSQPPLQPASPLPVPSPYTEQSGGLTEPHAASPTVARLLATAVTGPSFESAAASALVAELLDFAAACRLDYASALVAESVPANPPTVGGECALGTDVLEDRQEDFECLAAAVPRFASFLLAPEGDPDAPDIPTPRSYAEAITGPYSSQWQAAMDAEMASWKSTGTYVDEVPPPGVNIVDGMWIFRVKRPSGSPPVFKARYIARGFSQRQGVDYFHTFSPTLKMSTLWVLLHVAAQRDYELHSLDFITAFLQGSLHEEIWLRRPPGFTGSFPTADLSLFLHTDTSLPPFYVLVYVDDLVFATADTEALTLVKSELQKRHICTDLGERRRYLGLQITRDRAQRTITLTQSHMLHQSVEPSGPYPELVGCLMYLMTCTRPDLAYPLSLLDRYVAPDASWVDDSATQRSSQGYTFSLGSGSVSWRSTRSSSVLSSSCEAEIYAKAMAAQELCWLTYLLTYLGEQPRSPPVLYVDNKAMIALCQEHRLEHRTKHIAVRYFLARELQQRGQLQLAYVATRANTADVFTKALPPGDHKRFVTVLGLAELPDWVELLGQRVDIFALDYDAILTAMYALPTSADSTFYLCATPDPGTEPAALGAGEAAALGASASPALVASEAAAPGAGASRSFFRDSITLTPLSRPVPVSLADPSGGPILARSSTVLPCPAVPSGSLSGLHLPSFSTNLVSGADLQDQSASGPCSCRALSHQTLLWHHRLGHPSVQRLCSMHRHVLVSGLPRVLPPLPPSPAPPCLPCVEGRQRAAPHSSSFPPTEAPLHTLHLDVWGPARVRGQGHERYSLLVVDDYTRYTTVFPLRTKGEVLDVLIPWIRAARLQLRERFEMDFPVLRLHSDRGGEFSSDLLAAFCAEHGIRQTFTLPASPQQNGVAERRIGLVMEVARTSMIHAAAPHFLWPFAVRYAAHQLNLWPRVSLPETSPTLLWTGKVGDASRFRVWGARAFVHDTTADKLTARTVPCVFLGFVPDAPSWQFYHPTSRRVFPSQDVMFDESVDPLPALGPAASGGSQVDPPRLTSPVEVTGDSGPAEGGPARGAASGGAEPGGAEPGGAEPGDAEPGREESRGAEPGGTEPRGTAPGGAEASGEQSPWSGSRGPAAGGAGAGDSATGVVAAEGSGAAEGAGARGCRAAEGAGAGDSGAAAGAGTEGSMSALARSPWSSRLRPRVPLTSQQLHDWYGRRQGRASGARGSAAGGTSADVTGAGSGAGPQGARTGGTGAAGAGGAELGGAAAGGAGPGGAGDEGSGAAGGTGTAEGPGAAGAGSTAQPRLFFAPPSPSSQPPSDSVLRQVLSLPSSTGLPLQPGSPLPAPSPYTEQTGGLTERREPATRPVSPVRSGLSGRRVPCSCQPAVPGTHLVVRRPSSPPQSIPLPSPPASSLPTVPEPESDPARAAHPTVTRLLATAVTDPTFESAAGSALVAELVDFAAACGLDYAASLVAESASVCPPPVGGECALGTDVLEDRQEDLECLAATAPHLVSMLLAPEGDPDAPDIPTPCSYAEAITGSPPVFKARYVARGFSQQEGVDFFQTFSPTPKMTTLRGSLHEESLLRRRPGFTGSFPPGTQWSLQRPVYGLRQAPREWHDTLRTTLAALGFAPSTADPSLFLRTDTSLSPFYILVYVDDLVFATADTEALALVKSELQKRHTCTDLGELRSYLGLQITRDRARRTIILTQSYMVQQVLQRFGFTLSSAHATPLATGHSLSAPPSDESVEPSGPYPELVGCLMYLMTCTRPDLAYPLGLLARYVAPGRHRKVHMDVAKRVLRYLCSTSGMGLVLEGRGDVVLTGHSDASWVDDQATQRSSQGYTFSLGSGSVSWRSTRSSSVLSSSCEAEIYATAMAAQELR